MDFKMEKNHRQNHKQNRMVTVNSVNINLKKQSKEKSSKKIKHASLESIKSLTTHGIPNIFRNKYKLIKIMWILLTLGSASLSIYFIAETINEFFQFKVTTEVRLNDAKEFEFPTITICNKNQFSTKHSLSYLKNILETEPQLQSFDNQSNFVHDISLIDKIQQIRLFLLYTSAYRLMKNIRLLERKNLTTSIDDMLIACRYDRDIEFKKSQFEWIFNRNYGNCYRFNAFSKNRSMIKVKRPNAKYGLIIDLYVGQHDDINKIGLERGIYLSINRKNTNPYQDFRNIIDISPGIESNILVERSIFQKSPKPYSNCDFDQDKCQSPPPHLFNDLTYYNQVIDADYPYSQDICLDICELNYIKSKCNCTLAISSIRLPSYMKYCQTQNETKCIIEMNENLTNNSNSIQSIREICLTKCPIECIRTRYDSYVSTSKYPKLLVDIFKRDLKKSNRLFNEENLESDLIRLKIFFGSMSYVSYKETPSMNLFDLVSNLGGTLGLFLGMSLLSFTEFIEIILQTLLILVNQRIKQFTNKRNEEKSLN